MLTPCAGCSRHLRMEDATCPFCGHIQSLERPALRPPVELPVGKLTRAAVFFGGATLLATGSACGGNTAQPYGVPVQDPPPPTIAQPYGVPQPPPDPPPPTEQQQPPPPPPPTIAQPYGVPLPPPDPPPPTTQIVPPSGVQLYGAPPAPPPDRDPG